MFFLRVLRYHDGTFWYRGGTEKKCEKQIFIHVTQTKLGKDSSTTFWKTSNLTVIFCFFFLRNQLLSMGLKKGMSYVLPLLLTFIWSMFKYGNPNENLV